MLASGKLFADGALLYNTMCRKVEAHIKKHLIHMEIGGHIVPVVNIPDNFGGGIAANILCSDENTQPPFAAYYEDHLGYRKFGLRSSKDFGLDVEQIAKAHGGGGHVHAAGFLLPSKRQY